MVSVAPQSFSLAHKANISQDGNLVPQTMVPLGQSCLFRSFSQKLELTFSSLNGSQIGQSRCMILAAN